MTATTPPSELPIDETTGRPIWRGLPVPWIVGWTGEIAENELHAYRVGRSGLRLGRVDYQPGTTLLTLTDPTTYPYGIAAALTADRDELGLLWYRSRPHAQDTGEPKFAQLHARRVRACMLERRCQVCGRPFGQRPVTFLDSASVLDEDTGQHHHHALPPGRTMVTSTAPTCRACAAVAMRLCPAQRGRDRVLVTAHRYEPHAVLADVYGLDQRGQLTTVGLGMYVPLDDVDTLAMAVVKQMYVEITDYTEKEFTG